MSCLDDDALAELAGGTLADDARRPAEEHLHGCTACRALRDALVAALDRCRDLPEPKGVPPFAALEERLAAPVRVRIACTFCKGAMPERGVYCAACLAPHHADCWEEHGACAACAAALLVRPERPRPLSRSGFALAAFAAVFVGAGAAALAWRPPARPALPAPVRPAPPAPPRDDRRVRLVSIGAAKEPLFVDAPVAKVVDDRVHLAVVARDGVLRMLGGHGAHEWKAKVGEFGDPSTGATLSDEAVFTASCGTVQARDRRRGELLWSRDLGSPIVARLVLHPDGERLIAATADAVLVLLDARTGALREHHALTARLAAAPVVVDGAIVFACVDGSVGALARDRITRLELGHVTAGPVVSRGPVWVGTGDGALAALDAIPLRRTGGVCPTKGPVRHLVPVEDGVAFASETDVGWIGPGPRHEWWTRRLARSPVGLVTAVGPGDRPLLLVVSRDGLVTAHDLVRGAEAWRCSLEKEVAAPPVVVREELVVPTFDGHLAHVPLGE